MPAHSAPEFRVLVAEDDPAVRSAVTRVLELEGHEVSAVNDGNAALDAILAKPPHAVVMDVMMPFLDGMSVCRELRRRGNKTPILLLTARHEVGDRVAGLDAGADDYLVKPFAVEELVARLQALLRRSAGEDGDNGTDEVKAELVVGDLVVDPAGRTVTRSGREIELTRREFELIEVFARNPGIVLERDRLLELVWGYDWGADTNVVDVFVSYLRRKMEAEGEPRMIQTVRGVGFVLREPGEGD